MLLLLSKGFFLPKGKKSRQSRKCSNRKDNLSLCHQIVFSQSADKGIGVKIKAEVQKLSTLCRIFHNPDQQFIGNGPRICSGACQFDLSYTKPLQYSF